MEKTFIVTGKGLEEALDKAAIILHCERERIGYEILQEPKPGRYGQPGVACKLRVTPVAPSADESVGNQEGDDFWQVTIPLSQDDLESLPPSWFLKELGEAVARDLAAKAFAGLSSRTKPTRRVIHGHLTPADGPITHVGDLHVQGNIRKGLRVQATGSITVDGGVETAFLDAGDDVRVQEGLLGTVRSLQGSVHCRFAQGAQIEANNGDIRVAESAMHSRLHARCGIIIGEQLLGGICYGEDYVEIRTAGSSSGVPTGLYAGRNRALHERVEQIRQLAIRHVAHLAETTVRHEFTAQEEAGQQLSPDDRKRLWRAVLRNARINADLRRLSQEKSALLGMINTERGSRICITDRVYPGVKIGIDDTLLDVRNVTQFATFSKDYDSGGLRTTPYQ